jgi:hypothetical protein
MDRDEIAEKKLKSSHYANGAQVDDADAPVLPGITGREDNQGADPASESSLDIAQPVGAVPRSEVTGAHEPGMGANETIDGLSGTEEDARRAAEDETEVDDFEELPVFDRADAIPKII